MTHTELRKSSADTTSKLNKYLKEYHEITVEADRHGIKMVVWEKKSGNRRPVAQASRKCIGDVFNDIDEQLKE